MSLEDVRLLNRQRNAELFATFNLGKAKSDLIALKKVNSRPPPKRLSEPSHRAPARRKSSRIDSMPPVNYAISDKENMPAQSPPKVAVTEEKEDIPPKGDLTVAECFEYAFTDPEGQEDLRRALDPELQVFDESAASDTSLLELVSKLQALKVTPMTVCKVVMKRASCLIFHPRADKGLVLTGGIGGHLGLWNVSEPEEKPLLLRPHSSVISGIGVHREEPQRVVTASYDGSVRALDVETMTKREVFRAKRDMVCSFDFVRPNLLIAGLSNGTARTFDLREKSSESLAKFRCSKQSWTNIEAVTVHPLRTDLFAAATSGGGLQLWDQRQPNSCLQQEPNVGAVQWASFSPCSGCRLLTSSSGHEIRIYDTQDASLQLSKTTTHNNNTGRYLTPFRPAWFPQREDCFMVGSMNYPREVEVYSSELGVPLASLQHELLTFVNSVTAFHPTQDYLACANSSGRVHVFVP